jgi:uncharacterized protein YjiS (DUF1127 family)
MSNASSRLRSFAAKRSAATAASPIRSFARRLAAALNRAWREVEVTSQIIASRRQLRELDDRMLKDLGISRAEAEFESRRSVWTIKAREGFRDRRRVDRR